jgi:hypothetical protein
MGVLTSFIGSAVLIVITYFISRNFKVLLPGIFGKFLGWYVEYVYNNFYDAKKEMESELAKAKFINFLTCRYDEMYSGLINKFIEKNGKMNQIQDGKIKLLLPGIPIKLEDGNNGLWENQIDWIRIRNNECSQFDPAYEKNKNKLLNNIETTFREYSENKNYKIKFFSMPIRFRFLMTDRVAFFTPYQDCKHGKDCRVLRFDVYSEMYYFLEKLFDNFWNNQSLKNKYSEE